MIALALLSAPSADAPRLRLGIERYEAGDYRGALQALTGALEQAKEGRTRARIHVYVGLIQVRYGLENDAKGSFRAALKQHRRVRLPARSPTRARRLFRKLQRGMGLSRTASRKAPRARPAPTREAPPDKPAPLPASKGASKAAPKGASKAPSPVEPLPASPGSSTAAAVPSASSVEAGLADRPRTVIPPPTLAVAPPPPPLVTEARLNEADQADGDNRIAAWTLLGVGVAGIVTGVVFEALAVSNQQAARDAETAVRAAELTDTFQTQERVAWVGLGVGAALTIGATVWLTVD